jgi:arsenite methyltransferase
LTKAADDVRKEVRRRYAESTRAVAENHLAEEEQAERGSWVGCIAGALSEAEYVAGLEEAGFEETSVDFAYEGVDGMRAAFVGAVKSDEPFAQVLPVVEPVARAGCC